MIRLDEEEIEHEVKYVEQRLLNEVLTVVMYLNKNGVRLDVVRKMIETKIDHAFEAYDNIRDRYDDVIDKFRGV